MSIPSALFPQIIGKNSCNLAAIRQATSTQIDIDRHGKQSPNRTITVRYMYMYMYSNTCSHCVCNAKDVELAISVRMCFIFIYDFFLLTEAQLMLSSKSIN